MTGLPTNGIIKIKKIRGSSVSVWLVDLLMDKKIK